MDDLFKFNKKYSPNNNMENWIIAGIIGERV